MPMLATGVRYLLILALVGAHERGEIVNGQEQVWTVKIVKRHYLLLENAQYNIISMHYQPENKK